MNIPLADYFARLYGAKMQKRIQAILPQTVRILLEHDFPGKVRELQKKIEGTVICITDNIMRPEHLNMDISGAKKELEDSGG